ncbi:hypothetical protein AB4Z10_03700 [Bosea sp. RAF48]|uniref:hypothetical protein n=1 Tax=Bosea sp. RAF48 TaxID=3237480 RepID=UPI003F921314
MSRLDAPPWARAQRLVYAHALCNSLLPIITVAGLHFGQTAEPAPARYDSRSLNAREGRR